MIRMPGASPVGFYVFVEANLNDSGGDVGNSSRSSCSSNMALFSVRIVISHISKLFNRVHGCSYGSKS